MTLNKMTKISSALFLSASLFVMTPVFAADTSKADPSPSEGLRLNVYPSKKSLTVPTVTQAKQAIQQIPGAVAIVPDTQFKNSPTNSIKDILGWVPGVVTQHRSGPDGRLSIRGSGLSRNYHGRSINLFMDGIPINTSDGAFDLFEVDPSAYRYVEVYKGANALRYGANSLGGAINFVAPTGRDAAAFDSRLDAGSFGFLKSQMSSGGVSGPLDYFVTGSAEREDGYRAHSQGEMARGTANIGYQFSSAVETRFYINANTWNAQLPGQVNKATALNAPKTANPGSIALDQQRNVDSVRVANKTTMRFGPTTVDVGIFGVSRHVDHPIFQYLDYDARDYGGFVRTVDNRTIYGHRNRLISGINVHNGTVDTDQYVNNGGYKGALAASMVDTSENYSAYAENSFYFVPDMAVIAGGQFLHATRDRRDRFLSNGDQSGSKDFDIFSPKIGWLWDVDKNAQLFANISRSGEAPSFDANSFASPASSDLDAQISTTYEIGTRGNTPRLTWDVSAYRAQIKDELQCLTTGPFSPCTIVNADRTIHQGIEARFGVALLNSMIKAEDALWFNTTYSFNDFFFDDDATFGSNELPGVPRHVVRLETLYKHPDGLYAGPNVEWSPSSYYADNANSLEVDPYALLNFKMGYNVGSGFSGYVEGRNLLDKRYISSVAIAGTATTTSEIFNPGTGRAVYAGMSYRF